MASIKRVKKNSKWQYAVRWREVGGKQRTRYFDLKRDAVRFSDETGHKTTTGEYVPPEAGRILLGAWADQWLKGITRLDASTQVRYRGIVENYVRPKWGTIPLADIRHGDVVVWVGSMKLAPGTVRQNYLVLRSILDLAVRDRRIARNPAHDVALPRMHRSDPHFLDADQVEELSQASRDPLIIKVLAYSGLRFGELVGLQTGDVDPSRCTLRVVRSATEVAGRLVEKQSTKSHQSRTVRIPKFLAADLAAHLEGKAVTDRAFTAPRGGPLRLRGWRRRAFDPAVSAAALDPALTPHDLRHSAASLAISAGASVKAVQAMLGHATAVMTLDIYAHLFDADLDDVAVRLDEIAHQARTKAKKMIKDSTLDAA